MQRLNEPFVSFCNRRHPPLRRDNSVVPFLDISYNHIYAPDDTLTLAITVRYTRGQCTAQGIFIMVTLDINTPAFQLKGTGKGAKHCMHPEDPLAIRYEFSLGVEKLVLAGGALVVSDLLVEGLGYGAYQVGPDTSPHFSST